MNTNFRLFSSYTLSIFAILARKATGEHKLPEFKGVWYDLVSRDGLDSCGAEKYEYYNSFASSPCEYLAMIFSLYSGCVWDYSSCYNEESYSNMPAGFISNNPEDWNKILLNSSNPVSGRYNMSMICENDLTYSCSSLLDPFYDCPPNTRLSYDNVTMEIGCTTTPTPCLADVVGRDLDSAGISMFGHVGLVASYKVSNPNIIQVLTDPDAIRLQPLYGTGSFTEESQYWGERYGIEDNLRLSFTVASSIIQSGFDQTLYSFTYTLDMNYYPGGTSQHPTDCMFRCDSFVYYCYESMNLRIQPTFIDPITQTVYPVTLYNEFKCSADPAEYCSSYTTERSTDTKLLKNMSNADFYNQKGKFDTAKNTTTVIKILESLRHIFSTKATQRAQLPTLFEKYQGDSSASMRELFARCVCFELSKINPSKIESRVRLLLSDLLWQHKYLSNDNFLLALMENTVSFYLENPRCDWLSALFAVKAETQADKEVGMIAYVDQQEDVTDKANLVTASKFSSLSTLTDEKRRAYGSLFQRAYTDQSLSERGKKLLWLSLSEMKTPITETMSSAKFFQKSNATINRGTKRMFHP